MTTVRHRCITRATTILAAGVLTLFALAHGPQALGEEPDEQLLKEAVAAFSPPAPKKSARELPASPERISLGRSLFFDPRISVDGTVSCARCHQPALYGTDGLAKSHGIHDTVLPRNAPTVLNSGLQFKTHWDGVFENVEEQAQKALLRGFGNTDNVTAMARVKAIAGYAELFQKAFPGEADPVTAENWGKAIGAYERTLVTTSRLDDYLGGKVAALSAAERQGLSTFLKIGCAECHHDALVGGTEFREFGVVED